MKFDLGCGQRLQNGYIGVDFVPLKQMFLDGVPEQYIGAYRQINLLSFPWPITSNEADEVVISHFVEHIPHWKPGWPEDSDGWWLFFAELHRIMKRNGVVRITHPYSRSDRGFWDQTHTRYVHTYSWLYLSLPYRKEQGLNHYTSESVDFEVVDWEPSVHPLYEGQDLDNDNYRRALDLDFNVWGDVTVTLRTIK